MTNDAEQPGNDHNKEETEQASLVKNADDPDKDDDDGDNLYQDMNFRQRKKFNAIAADGEYGKQLKNNVFSLIYTTEMTTPSFFFAIFFVGFQSGLLILALLDLIQFNDSNNPLQVPTDVSLEVRITSIMCLILAIPLFWDLMDSIERLQQGAPPADIEGAPKGASTAKYYFAFTLQFLVGVLYQIAMFILVVTPNSVVEMFLNFAALEFITEVDEIAFALAVRGYLFAGMKKSCVAVTQFKLPPRKGGRCVRRTVYIVFTAMVLGMYGIIWSKQRAGDFECKRILVQFGDGFITTLPVFSGFYLYSQTEYLDGRPVYMDANNRGSAFRYCIDPNGQDGFWVFNHINNTANIKSIADMCTDYISRSPATPGFSIMDDPSNTWLTKKDSRHKLEFPVDYFTIQCADCEETNCDGTCNAEGFCECPPGQYGVDCQFYDPPCPKTNYDFRGQPFTGAGEFYSSEFDLLLNRDGSPAFAFGRPIYAFSSRTDLRFINVTDIIMNLGRRYFMFGVHNHMVPGLKNKDLSTMDMTEERAIIAEYLQGIHPYYDWIQPEWVTNASKTPVGRPVFVSAPLDIGTASDNISPLGLPWWRVDATVEVEFTEYYDLYIPGAQVDTTLLCSTCAHNHPCSLGGTCNFTTGVCNCACDNVTGDCFGGPTCEVEPECVANATCVLYTP